MTNDENPFAPPVAPLESRPNASERPFKFKYLDDHGRETGFLAKKGYIDAGSLVIDGNAIPMASIPYAAVRHNRVALTMVGGDGGASTFWLAIQSGPGGKVVIAEWIAREVGRGFSADWTSRRLATLRAEGREGTFRIKECPHCEATIDLTGFPETPQVYCRHCDTLVSPPDKAPPDESRFHRCDTCGYYSDPEIFDSTVVVFALAVTAWWSNRRFICRTCRTREAWKTLFKNLPTLVGAPTAAFRLARVYLRGASRSGPLAGLDAANREARSGRLAIAETYYGEILSRLRHSAGVHYNRARALSAAGDWTGCLAALDRVWADCANFAPGLPLAKLAYESLGRGADFATLADRWQGHWT